MRANVLIITLTPTDQDGRTVAPGSSVTIGTELGPVHGVCARSSRTSVELIGVSRPEREHGHRATRGRVTLPRPSIDALEALAAGPKRKRAPA